MGGGVAGWLTPGWIVREHRLEPHIAKPNYVREMLMNGENPKPLLVEECKDACQHWERKLKRCEVALESIIKVNPTKTCMYPFRDWVTCVEACTQPLIHNSLEGVVDTKDTLRPTNAGDARLLNL